jgi:hypothetical protein
MAKKFAAAAVEPDADRVPGIRSSPVAPGDWLFRMLRVYNGADRSRERGPSEVDVGENALLEFRTERSAAHELPAGRHARAEMRRTSGPGRWLAVGVAVVGLALVAGAFTLMRRAGSPIAASVLYGRLTLETRPAGAQALVDGVSRGSTPLTLTLPAGAHRVTLRSGGDERTVEVALTAGAQVTQHFEFATPEASLARLGKISVVTDPPGARVQIDGQARGVTPVTVSDLSASDHKVAVSSETGSAERSVSVDNNATTVVVFSLPRVVSPIAGWLALTAPFDVHVIEADNVIATGRAAKIMLAAGNHAITLSNDALQYRESRQIQVAGGRTTTVQIDPPKVAISANARPWADVIIDGANVGQTPISNMLLSIGEHDVVFRHPQLGERRQTMVVTMGSANRIAVDLRK